MLSNLSFSKTVVFYFMASGQFGTKALRCPTSLDMTEAAVNWALKEMEVLRRTILVKEVTELKSMEELRTLQNHLRRCQGKYWEETFPLSK